MNASMIVRPDSDLPGHADGFTRRVAASLLRAVNARSQSDWCLTAAVFLGCDGDGRAEFVASVDRAVSAMQAAQDGWVLGEGDSMRAAQTDFLIGQLWPNGIRP